MDRVFSPAHDSWSAILNPVVDDVKSIFSKISNVELAPERSEVFAAFAMNLSDVRCVIIGQDPYPTFGNAHGLAFSTRPSVRVLPASLKNIYRELHSDMDLPIPSSGDLSQWKNQGVLLLNRVLTTQVGLSNEHAGIGWERVTQHICEEIGSRGVPAILWGAKAQELQSAFTYSVNSVHPSPLSAYKGFFGSRPFSTINAYLESVDQRAIDWSLK
jgi:uracil-DNA glycosylase